MIFIFLLYGIFLFLTVGPIIALLFALKKDAKEMDKWYESYFDKLQEVNKLKAKKIREAENRKIVIYFPGNK